MSAEEDVKYLFNDTFTESTDEDLDNHTSDSGHAYIATGNISSIGPGIIAASDELEIVVGSRLQLLRVDDARGPRFPNIGRIRWKLWHNTLSGARTPAVVWRCTRASSANACYGLNIETSDNWECKQYDDVENDSGVATHFTVASGESGLRYVQVDLTHTGFRVCAWTDGWEGASKVLDETVINRALIGGTIGVAPLNAQAATTTHIDELQFTIFEDVVGPHYYQVPAPAAGTQMMVVEDEEVVLDFADNFNRADEDLTDPWTLYDEAGAQAEIASNAVSTDFQGFAAGGGWGPDVGDSWAEIETHVSGGDLIGPMVRMSGPGSDNLNGYWYSVDTFDGDHYLYRYDGGSRTLLVSDVGGPNIAVGDVLRIEVIGNRIAAYHKGREVLSANDNTYHVGQIGFITEASGSVSGDNFGGGRITGIHRPHYYGAAAGGGGDVTIPVPIGSLSFTGLVPDAITPNLVDVPVGALSLSGLAPSVEIAILVDVPVGSLSLAGLAPTVLNPAGAEVPAGSLTLTGLAPSPEIAILVDVPVGALSFAGLVPTILNPQGMIVPTGALVLTGQTPSVATGVFSITRIEHNPAGDIVTGLDSGRSYKIVGTEFGTVQGTVTIDGISQTITSWADTEIIITAVQGATSMGDATMTVEKNA